MIFNADDKNLSALNLPKKRMSYGFNQADLIAKDIISENGRQQFDLLPAEKKKENISSRDLVQAIKNASKFDRTSLKNILFAKDLEETYQFIQKNILPGDLLLIVGAGDIYKITKQLDLEKMKEYN